MRQRFDGIFVVGGFDVEPPQRSLAALVLADCGQQAMLGDRFRHRLRVRAQVLGQQIGTQLRGH